MNEALQKAQAAMKAKREAGESVERLDPLEKAKAKPTSLRLATNAKCFDCVGGKNADNGYRRAIRECCAISCPLHTVRPYQRDESEDEEP